MPFSTQTPQFRTLKQRLLCIELSMKFNTPIASFKSMLTRGYRTDSSQLITLLS